MVITYGQREVGMEGWPRTLAKRTPARVLWSRGLPNDELALVLKKIMNSTHRYEDKWRNEEVMSAAANLLLLNHSWRERMLHDDFIVHLPLPMGHRGLTEAQVMGLMNYCGIRPMCASIRGATDWSVVYTLHLGQLIMLRLEDYTLNSTRVMTNAPCLRQLSLLRSPRLQ